MEMKVLNLYAGIGGNRKLWTDCEVTGVEYNESIANIYADLYPKDTVVVGDAHQYLLDHYKEFDFIWSSPPCPPHSRTNYFIEALGNARFPDMKLYEEIIFLSQFFKGKYCVENVISYYTPLIKPQQSGRHYFWANFKLPTLPKEKTIGRMNGVKADLKGETQRTLRAKTHSKMGFDLSKYSLANKEKVFNNCVLPEIGLAIFNSAKGIIESNRVSQNQLF